MSRAGAKVTLKASAPGLNGIQDRDKRVLTRVPKTARTSAHQAPVRGAWKCLAGDPKKCDKGGPEDARRAAEGRPVQGRQEVTTDA